MTSSPDKPTTTAPRSVNRWGMGALASLQTVSLVLILAVANYLAASHWQRIDLSRASDFTLSSVTTRYLASDAIRNRATPVSLIVAFRRSSAFHDQVRALAEEYGRLSNGKIAVEFVDPVRDADRTQQIATTYDTTFTRDAVIIDASAPEQPKAKSPNLGAVAAEDMVEFQTDQQGQRKPTGFKGEDAITAALIRAVEGKPRTILFLGDKSDLDASGETSPWKVLSDALFARNILLKPVNLADLDAIPSDTLGVALVAPKYDLDERELAMLERYWGSPKSSVLITLDPASRPPRLRSFLRKLGVSPRDDRILTTRSGQNSSTVHVTFTPGLEFTRDFWGKSTVFEGATCSLEVREGAEDLATRKVFPATLAEAADGYWGESRYTESPASFQPEEDHARPLPIAAAVIRGNATDDRLASQTSRLVVISNSSFLHPDRLRPEQIDFLTSAANWLIGREDLVGIGPKKLGTYKLPLLDAQVAFINRANLFFLPVFALLAALGVWNARRQ